MATYEEIQQTKLKYQDELLAMANVKGIGIGYVRKNGQVTSEVGIIVYVGEKRPLSALSLDQVIPKNINGVWVDVVESNPSAEIAPFASHTQRLRPAPGGVSIGHYGITAGTLACILYRGNQPVILSNNHVLANENSADQNDWILQPGKADGGRLADDAIGSLIAFEPIVFDGPNLVDAAIALPISADAISTEILEVGQLTGIAVAKLGDGVYKSGRTTGLTYGVVIAVDVDIQVAYGGGIARCVDQLEIRQQSDYAEMVAGGDSGSAVLTADNRLCGLIFAGDSNGTGYANRIEHVMSLLGLEFKTPVPEPPPAPPPAPELPPTEKPGCNPISRVMLAFRKRK